MTSAAKATAISASWISAALRPTVMSPMSPTRAPQNGIDRLGERGGEREHKGEMADLDDHCVAVVPSCQRPCFFKASTTSRGI